MGRSTKIIGQHTLNINDRDDLMRDLSQRFDANVYVVFWSSEEIIDGALPKYENPELQKYFDGQMFLLDALIIDENKESVVLDFCDYQFQWLFDQHGEKAGELEAFKKQWPGDFLDRNEVIQGFIDGDRLIELYFKDWSVSLSRGTVEEFSFGRTYFMELLLHHVDCMRGKWQKPHHYREFLEIRNHLKQIIEMLGGKCAYHVLENGKYGGEMFEGGNWGLTWEEFEKQLHKGKREKYMVNLCELLTNESYMKEIKKGYFDKNIDYTTFYDDFRELNFDQIIRFNGV